MSDTPHPFRAAFFEQLDDEYGGPGLVPRGLRLAGHLMDFLVRRMSLQEFRGLLKVGWRQIVPRLEEAARTYGYERSVPALTPQEAGMLLDCAGDAFGDTFPLAPAG